MTAAQVAGALFVSPKTVSANLTKIYRKLGITNRYELAGRLQRVRPAQPPPSQPPVVARSETAVLRFPA